MGKVAYTNTPDRVDQAEVRASHGVRLVSDIEEGTGVNALPSGVYGYTDSPGLINAPLFVASRYRSYETHKLTSGEVFVIAYADADTAQKTSAASADVTVLEHPEPGPNAGVIVKISHSRIRQRGQHAAPNQDGFTVTVAAGPGLAGG